jgi:hypothetical protein
MDDARMNRHSSRVKAEPRRLNQIFGNGTGLRALLRWTGGLAIALALLIAVFFDTPVGDTPTGLTTFFFSQDLVGLWLLGIVLLGAGVLPEFAPLGRWSILTARPRLTELVMATLVTVVVFLGNRILYRGFALSYDEVMAEFDAQIFRSGALIQPIPPEWQAYRKALAPHFLLPIPGDVAWVSAYLPVNALMRALFSFIGSSALTGAVLLGVALLAIMSVSRRLWPERPDAAVVAAVLLALSPQAVFAAMTPYAMTAHLAMNLVWLSLFLRGGRAGHAGAILTGFLACGLHQLIFHPLFVAPFLLGLIVARSWRLATIYVLAYGVICLFWTLYWPALLAVTGLGTGAEGGQAASVGVAYQMSRLTALLAAFDWNGVDLMAKNLLRFVTWQSPVLWPLVFLAWPSILRGDHVARALAAGLGLTIMAMFILLPYQGHGWGYRYLHGLLGSVCLLGAQGWINLTRGLDGARLASARACLGLACAAGLIVLPLRAAQVDGLVAPYAEASEIVASMNKDIVLIDDTALVFGSDLVRNTPTLSNRPLRVLRTKIQSAQDLKALCARGSVGVFGAAEAARSGLGIVKEGAPPGPTPNPCAPTP